MKKYKILSKMASSILALILLTVYMALCCNVDGEIRHSPNVSIRPMEISSTMAVHKDGDIPHHKFTMIMIFSTFVMIFYTLYTICRLLFPEEERIDRKPKHWIQHPRGHIPTK